MKKAVTKLIAVALAVIVIAAGVGMGAPGFEKCRSIKQGFSKGQHNQKSQNKKI